MDVFPQKKMEGFAAELFTLALHIFYRMDWNNSRTNGSFGCNFVVSATSLTLSTQ
jgi:hypothetical protein